VAEQSAVTTDSVITSLIRMRPDYKRHIAVWTLHLQEKVCSIALEQDPAYGGRMSYGIRRLAAGAISFLALLAFSSQAQAARPNTSGWGEIDSAAGHFEIHFPASVPTADAQTVADNLEHAYAVEVGSWGFDPPVNDGDSKVDVYLAHTDGHLGEASPDTPGPATSGSITIDPGSTGDAEAAAHELFHLLQYAIDSRGASFLKEGTAEWAGANVAGNTGWLLTYWGAPDQPLDCLAGSACAGGGYSYARWIFFDYLSERYGTGIIREILTRAAADDAGDDPAKDLQAIADVLAAHGTSLTQVFNGFTAANVGESYSFPGLAGNRVPPRSSGSFYTGAASLTLPATTLGIDHLAARYMYFYSGDPRVSSAGCGAARLRVTVDLPAGSESVPSISDAFGVRQLTVNGSSASADIPFTSCPGSVAALGIPNPGSADGQQFVVHTSLQLTPVKPRATAAPHIRFSVARRAAIARHRPYLRFKIRSSGRGILQVLFKAHYVRGSYHLRAGSNTLKLRLPAGVRGGSHQIVLTAFSTTGKRGQTIRRHVRIHLSRRAA
jgi:hypothetical protein